MPIHTSWPGCIRTQASEARHGLLQLWVLLMQAPGRQACCLWPFCSVNQNGCHQPTAFWWVPPPTARLHCLKQMSRAPARGMRRICCRLVVFAL